MAIKQVSSSTKQLKGVRTCTVELVALCRLPD